MLDVEGEFDDVCVEVIDLQSDGGYELYAFKEKGELALHDTPGVCFVVHSEDLETAMFCLLDVYESTGINDKHPEENLRVNALVQIYNITCDDGQLKLVVPRDDSRSIVEKYINALEERGISFVQGGLFNDRSEEARTEVGMYNSPLLEHIFPEACDTEEAIVEKAERLGLFDDRPVSKIEYEQREIGYTAFLPNS
jgi:hypothetical protein